jgi:hypothetical protein
MRNSGLIAFVATRPIDDEASTRYGPRADEAAARAWVRKKEASVMRDPTESATTGVGRSPDRSAWDWFGDEYPFGIDMMFVSSVEPERILEALGADPAAARMLSAEAAVEILGSSWVRTGRTGEWAFAIGAASLSIQEYEQAALGLSAGTEVVLYLAGIEVDYFLYFADGVTMTSFEPLMSAWRDGADPDRFVRQMRQVGLELDPPQDDDDSEQDLNPTIALLEMLTLALGIRLSRETAIGPLLTDRSRGREG